MNNDEILTQYEDFVRGKYPNEKTADNYITHPRKMIDALGKPIDEIKQQDITDYINKCKKTLKQNGNALRFYLIRRFFEWAELPGIDPGKIEQVKRKDAGKVALDDEEIEKIIKTVEKLSIEHRLIFYLEFYCILRPKEIRNLKLSDIGKNKIIFQGKRGIKPVTMPNIVKETIEEYKENYRLRGINEQENQYLLIGTYGRSRGKHYITNTHISKTIKEVCMYAGIDIPPRESASSYLIKRSSITWLLKEGYDPKLVQLQARHENLSQTLQYDRISDKHLNQFVDSFESKIRNLKQKSHIDTSKNI